MYVSLTKPNDKGKRNVVLICDGLQMNLVAPVVAEVMGKYAPKRDFIPATGEWKYTFPPRSVDDVLMAFPQAAKSPGLQRRLDSDSTSLLHERDVDPFKIPGLYDRLHDRKIRPFDYQYVAIAEITRFLNGEMTELEGSAYIMSFLLNDQMGLGKTFEMLGGLLMLRNIWRKKFEKRGHPMTVLVVTPKNGKFVWERENARFADFDLQVIDAARHKPVERDDLIERRAEITVVNPEMLRHGYPGLYDWTYDIVILDEYHRFGSPTSQQTKGMLRLRSQRWLPASGTPYLNRPEQLWPMLHRCWPDIFHNYEAFATAIRIVDRPTGKVVGYRPKYTRLLKSFMEERSLRRRKDQVLKDLPKVQPVELTVELTVEQRRLYNKIRNEALIELADGGVSNVAKEAIKMRLKQACFSPELFDGSRHSAKIDELMAHIESLVASGEKAIIFSEWRKAARILQREFEKYNPAYVDGGVTGDKRLAQADMFNTKPDCYLYIGTIGANQEAISLGAATTAILTDKDPSPQVNAQAVGRSAAGGLRGLHSTVSQVTVISMIAADTYESREVESSIDFKAANFNAIIETDHGLKVAKREVKKLSELI